jgi:hypothetical protein
VHVHVFCTALRLLTLLLTLLLLLRQLLLTLCYCCSYYVAVAAAAGYRGPTGVTLCSNYEQRDTEAYKTELGNALCNFSRSVPHGMLVFFPTYSVMDRCVQW